MLYAEENIIDLKNSKRTSYTKETKDKKRKFFLNNKIILISSILFIIFTIIDILLIYNFLILFQGLK